MPEPLLLGFLVSLPRELCDFKAQALEEGPEIGGLEKWGCREFERFEKENQFDGVRFGDSDKKMDSF